MVIFIFYYIIWIITANYSMWSHKILYPAFFYLTLVKSRVSLHLTTSGFLFGSVQIIYNAPWEGGGSIKCWKSVFQSVILFERSLSREGGGGTLDFAKVIFFYKWKPLHGVNAGITSWWPTVITVSLWWKSHKKWV